MIDLHDNYWCALKELTAPGMPFELVDEPAPYGVRKNFARLPSNLTCLLEQASDYGDRSCLVYGDSVVTYAEFVERVRRFAVGLARYAAPGDRIALLGANHPEWVVSFWAAICAGMVPVPLNGWWRRQELQHALVSTGARILIGDIKRLSKLGDVSETAPDIQTVFCWDNSASSPGFLPLTTLAESLPADFFPSRPDDLAVLVFTSGTTGKAKAAMLTHGAWLTGLKNAQLAATIAVMRAPGLQSGSGAVSVLAGLPFFHVGGGHGQVVGGIASGQTLIIPDGRFDPARTLDLIERHRIERWSAVPAMVQQVCSYGNEEGRDLSSLLTLGYGAAPSGEALLKAAQTMFPNLRAVSNAYGLTEAGSVFAMNTGGDFERYPTSVGRPFITADVRIVSEQGLPLPVGEAGEIQVRGPFLMKGYWNAPEETNTIFEQDGWLKTGDLGYLDAEGFIFLSGRKKDIIIRGGENILAEEVERCLEEHPSIGEAAVIAVPSDRLGEEVKAVIRLSTGHELGEGDVRDWVRERLAHFKVPSYVEFRQAPLPRNAAGKLLKLELVARGTTQFDEMF